MRPCKLLGAVEEREIRMNAALQVLIPPTVPIVIFRIGKYFPRCLLLIETVKMANMRGMHVQGVSHSA